MKKMRKRYLIILAIMITILSGTFAFITYAATGDILPNDGAIVNSAQITSTITGTAPFDTYEADGRDMSPDDNIVRSFDQITYTVEATMAMNGATDSANYKGGDIYIEGTIPEACTYEEWDLSSMAWGELVSISEDRRTVVLKYSMDSAKVTIPGKQELSMIMKVGGEKNGTIVQPSFRVWLQGNNSDSSSAGYEAKEVTSKEVTVSSKPKYNVRLRQNKELSHIATIDIDGVPTKGRMYGFITTMQLYNDASERGLKGVEYPAGDITFDIGMYMEKYDSAGNYVPGLEEKVTPILYNYAINYVDKVGIIPDRPMDIVSEKTASGRLVAPRGSRDIYYNTTEKRIGDSIYDSGDFTCVQNEHVISVTNNNYKFDGMFPVRNAEYDGLPIAYDPNIGCFAAGYFEIFVPFTEDTADESCTYGLAIVDDNFSATSLSGVTVTDQRRTSDDDIYLDFYQQKAGKFWTNVTIRDIYKEYVHSSYDKGDGYGFKGQKLWLASRFDSSSSNDSDLEIKTVENMLKFDDECFVPIDNIDGKTWHVENTGSTSLDYKLYYAAKPDGTGWTSDEEMEAAQRTDLVYFETLDELKASNSVCVGFLAESQTGTLYAATRSTVYFPVKVKNSADVSSVYQTVNYWEIHEAALDRTLYYATNPDSNVYPQYDYSSENPDYIKTAYDENGVQIGGTHNAGAEIGNSLLVIDADTNVQIETSQIENNVPKINYDFGKNEYQVDFKITPYITIPDTVDTISSAYSQNVVVRAYLRADQITYMPSSCEFGDPVITTVVEDGIEYNVLQWIVPDCKINEEITPLYFSGHLNPKLENNTQVSVKATSGLQNGDEIRPELKQDTYTVQVINLSSHRLYKEAEKKVVDKEEELHFIATYLNSTDKDVTDFQLLDILPYNGDARGSVFNGTYTIKSINIKQTQNDVEIPNDNLSLYLSNDENSRNITSKDTNIGVGSEWELQNLGDINKEAVAIALKGTAKATSEVVIDIILQPKDNIGGDKYINSVGVQTAVDTTELVSSDVSVNVIARSIDGIVWYDKNINGLLDDDETRLSNVNVAITNSDGTTVVDTMGNTITTTTTDENGYYTFYRLYEGNYNIKVTLPNEYISFTDMLVGNDYRINSHVDSNGNINNIEVKDNPNSFNLVVGNQNAGVIKENGQIKVLHVLEGTDVSDPENVTDVLYETEIYKGELGASYTTHDRLAEINSTHDVEYELATVSENDVGTYKNEVQYIIYTYRLFLDVPDFDFSLRKYITGINGTAIMDRIPNIKTLQAEESKVGAKRSVFSWDETRITEADKTNNMIQVANLFGLTEVYQYIPHELFSAPETTLADFVTKLRDETDNNMKVTYLTGDASYYAKPDSIKRRINYLVTYNEGTGKDAPITSIALDIEPWTLDLTEDYSTTYKQTLEEIYPYAKEKGIEVTMVIPYWLDTADSIADKTLYQSIIQNSDDTVIMNYYQKAYLTAMDTEIEEARNNGKTIYSAAELQAPNDKYGVTDEVTYYEEGLEQLFSDWKKMEDKYNYENLAFTFHNIDSLEILLDMNKINGKFEYKHQKAPLKVETNDLVEYTISVYNEGEKDGNLTSIVDKLPEGLEFVSIDSNYNAVVSEDKQTLTITPKTTVNIPAFNGRTLEKVDIKLTCKVVKEKTAETEILTNIAYINGFDAYSDGQLIPDIDSSVLNFPKPSSLSNYIGKSSNKTDLSDVNYYYRGQEDDDDFEKVYLEAENSHNITTEVDGEGGIISGQNEAPYEKVIHGGNSVKDLIITPDSEYKVSKVTINGVETTFTEDKNGTVILPKFENMVEDKHIIVTFEQIKGKVTVTKVDSKDNTKLLEGATFKLEKLDETGNVDTSFTAIEKTTDATGKIEFADLLVGKYRITETKAPTGYELARETIDVEITRENTELNIKATDRLKLELPEAGGINYTIIISIIGISLMAISIATLKLKTKK